MSVVPSGVDRAGLLDAICQLCCQHRQLMGLRPRSVEAGARAMRSGMTVHQRMTAAWGQQPAVDRPGCQQRGEERKCQCAPEQW
jgi:hypothetical protein